MQKLKVQDNSQVIDMHLQKYDAHITLSFKNAAA
jgi:hypothetical protein